MPVCVCFLRTVCFSSDDSYIASGSTKLIKIWERYSYPTALAPPPPPPPHSHSLTLLALLTRSSQQCIHTMQSGYALSSVFVPGDRHLLVGTKVLSLFEFTMPSFISTHNFPSSPPHLHTHTSPPRLHTHTSPPHLHTHTSPPHLHTHTSPPHLHTHTSPPVWRAAIV